MKARIHKHTLEFKSPAGTSRGILKTKDTWFLILENENKKGIGEINMFRGLSYDDKPGFEQKLEWLCDHIHLKPSIILEELLEWPAIRFGYETALKSFQSTDCFELFPSVFTQGADSISINGLIWMGDQEFMLDQLEEKMQTGFSCIKLKIGAIDFEKELHLLQVIRSRFSANEMTIRVDANGAFSIENAMEKLNRLSVYDVHSIEQPIKPGQYESMAQLCQNTPVPIALDEELIGLHTTEEKQKCLDLISPQFIILKPALVGGFQSCREWINIAEERNIDWWMTSALESNVGLNAIAQFTYTLGVTMPQGLGTGGLFTNNIDAPLEIKKGELWCNNTTNWNTNYLNL
ncbi:o-succinylbenzoate synthase [Nonlabens sp. SCSIO 43208]|uniref:o-succinylbenzoate synthase n=1 Tax=Nonlabens sp. SCSIO 43208 TaxID=2793009 RepID=UPI003D6A806E